MSKKKRALTRIVKWKCPVCGHENQSAVEVGGLFSQEIYDHQYCLDDEGGCDTLISLQHVFRCNVETAAVHVDFGNRA